MAQTKPKAAQFYGVSDNGTDGQFLKTDGTGGMSWASTIVDPTITSIDYPGTQTAADPAGGESIIINGTLFASGVTCTVGGTSAVTAFNSATQITITTPAKAAGQYAVVVTNPDGGTVSQANFIQDSGVPVWSTAAGNIGSIQSGSTASFQVTATEGSDTIEYAVTTGTLPTGLSLATATGAITGTAGSVSASTTTTFSITATDDENQTSSARSFNIIVTPDVPSNHFNTVLWSGNNTARSIPTGFAPDLIWLKNRNNDSNSSHRNLLFDTLRTSGYYIHSDGTSSQQDYAAAMTGITSSGFNLGGGSAGTAAAGINNSGGTYVGWSFKAGGAAVANNDGNVTSQVSANTTLGFSIATYTGNNTQNASVGHGLGTQPEFLLIKRTDAANSWWAPLPILGSNQFMELNTTAGATTDVQFYYTQTTDVFQFTSSSQAATYNASGGNYVMYSFTSKPGFSKVGTYTGARPNDVLVQTGFKPAFIIIKAIDATDDWFMVDDKREGTSAPNKTLLANSTAAESSFTGVEFLANGFKLVGSANSGGTNNSGTTFIYLAFAADPSTTTPSLANSFEAKTYTGNGGTQNIVLSNGMKPDFTWIKNRNDSNAHALFDSVRGAGKMLVSSSTDAEAGNSGNLLGSFNNNGFQVNRNYLTSTAYDTTNGLSNLTYVSWNWKAEGLASINTDGTIDSVVSANQAAGFSIVNYTGNGSGGTVGHGLNTPPEMYIVKSMDHSAGWYVYHVGLDSSNPQDYNVRLNETAARQDSLSYWNDTAPTSSVYTIGTTTGVSKSNTNFISYCFTSIAGYSKLGTFVGNGSATGPIVTTGFQPDYLMWKKSSNSSSANWIIIDSARSTSNGRRNLLYANLSSAEDVTSYDVVDFNSNGFQIKTHYSGYNQNGETFIYLAIKQN